MKIENNIYWWFLLVFVSHYLTYVRDTFVEARLDIFFFYKLSLIGLMCCILYFFVCKVSLFQRKNNLNIFLIIHVISCKLFLSLLFNYWKDSPVYSKVLNCKVNPAYSKTNCVPLVFLCLQNHLYKKQPLIFYLVNIFCQNYL